MSDSKISTLNSLTSPQSTDVLPIVDNSSTPITKKISIGDLDTRWLVSPLINLGEIIYGDVGATAVALDGNITTTRKFLSQTGTGSVSAAPSWVDPNFVPYTGGNQDLSLPNNQISMDNLLVGDQGYEGDHITVAGNIYTAAMKVSDLNASHPADFLFHRHSTTTPALLIIARSNKDTASHAALTNSQIIFTLMGTGTAGSDYKQFGQIEIGADDTGTISETSAPGKVNFKVTPNSSIVPVVALTIHNDLSSVFGGTIKPGVAGGYLANDSTPGASGSFTTADSKTVTVKDGLIVSIS